MSKRTRGTALQTKRRRQRHLRRWKRKTFFIRVRKALKQVQAFIEDSFVDMWEDTGTVFDKIFHKEMEFGSVLKDDHEK